MRLALALAVGLALAGSARADERAHDFRALCEATRGGDSAQVAVLLNRGVDPRHPPESSEDMDSYFASTCDPVQNAVEAGDEASLRQLLSHGANPSWLCCDGPTALGRAVERRRPELANLLLDADADPVFGLPVLDAFAQREWRLTARLTAATARALPLALWGVLLAPLVACGVTLRGTRGRRLAQRIGLSLGAALATFFAIFLALIWL